MGRFGGRDRPTLQLNALDGWNESDHPRSENGQFGSGGGHPHHKALTDAGEDPEKFNKAAASLESLPKEEVYEVARQYIHPKVKLKNKADAIHQIKGHFYSKLYDRDSHKLAGKANPI